MKRLWDISPPVHRASPVFSMDTPYQQTWVAQLEGDCPVNVCAITTSPHVGAHADAPLHYDNQGATVGQLPLAPFIGPCRVIHVIGQPLVRLPHVQHALAKLPPRVLLRSYQRWPSQFDDNCPALAPELLHHLADLGVTLVGTDSASVDPSTSKDLPAHQVLRQRNMRVLENLLLDDVPEGDYELIALPLKLIEADASPVRAILREI